MKIRKTSLENKEELSKDTMIPEDAEPITGKEADCTFGKACDKILEAIEELSNYSSNPIASDSIANLSVVLLDLQNGGK